MNFFDERFPTCGAACTQCNALCKRADAIDSTFASRLAFMLECMIVDSNANFQSACDLLDEYKAEWEKVNPTPPTFMGEPMPAERRERLKDMMDGRAARAAKGGE